MEAVVPAGDGQLEHFVYELEHIGDGMCGKMPLILHTKLPLSLALLHSEEIVLLLLHDYPQDDGLKVPKAGTHVQLAQLFECVVHLGIFDVAVDDAFVVAHRFQDVEDVSASCLSCAGVPY